MRMKGKEYIRPEIVKFGVAVALSLGGILYYFLRTKRVRPLNSPPSSYSSDYGNGTGSEGEEDELVHEDLYLHKDNLTSDCCPGGRCIGVKDGILLPEYDELLNEFDLASMKDSNSPTRYVETLASDTETQKGYNAVKMDDYEQEIKCLRNMVKNLKERERDLEIQLLEYYDLKEQESAIMELHNRLKISSMETRLFTLKIESLQADNKRLEEEVMDHARVVADLEVARSKLKMLKRELKSESEHNKEHILSLQKDIQPKLVKIKRLEEEVEELRKLNCSLQEENSDLGRRLDYAQILANSVLENEEPEALKEENYKLRKQNEDLSKEIEQIHENQCNDVEELVYLRWINACLRHELRNYQAGPGETAARDLSKTLSPKSEAKAKQLILKYANKEDLSARTHRADSDMYQSKSNHASVLADSDGSPHDHTIARKPYSSSKKNVFGKLLKLLRGHSHDHSQISSLEDVQAEEDVVGRYSSVSSSGVSPASDVLSYTRASSLSSSRPSLESTSRQLPEISSARTLDLFKEPYTQSLKSEKMDPRSRHTCTKTGLTSGDVVDSPNQSPLNQELEIQNFDLLKYAEALKNSRVETPEFEDSRGEAPEFQDKSVKTSQFLKGSRSASLDH
ncbi:Actin binding protein family [Heracleum sosnowskyi]|uniref:Actin binding protein family n=1 Tax=Heracleum sosnowskyi TaxID=360622 RepID=A0AAD8H5X6_9APIA|nr:Actin binding protein family [Heracleum sosnowskyi]